LSALDIRATLAQSNPPEQALSCGEMSGGATFRVAAAVATLVGALFLVGSWDGLYDSLDLPQALPALGPQIGGLGLLALAFLLWSAASVPELRRPVAIAGVLFYLGSAIVIASWLILRDKADLQVGDGGWAVLIVTAIAFAGLGAALVRAPRR
jgi:FtsH-binding integral membrane protein